MLVHFLCIGWDLARLHARSVDLAVKTASTSRSAMCPLISVFICSLLSRDLVRSSWLRRAVTLFVDVDDEVSRLEQM